MGGAGILIGGILALAAVLALSAAIVAVAPYIAVFLIGLGILSWLSLSKNEKPPNQEITLKPVKPPEG